ncbi:MAG: peptide chain release factor N(5)-glutamine methyltransferase [Betaproteobacteria bacterium]|nr:peptide chain release factor N(5)-glutamine methyltransferase [Betaproteobacteria bacterium]
MSDVTIAECLARADVPRLDAQLLLAAVTGMSRVALMTHPERPVSPAQQQTFRKWCARRRAGEPVAYLIGEREFYGLPFTVSPAVLIPRPETELLVEFALDRLPKAPCKVLDLGTGSGAIAIAIAKHAPTVEVWATDVSPDAIVVASANAKRHGVAIQLLRSNWFAQLGDSRFDIIVTNPPYVAAGDPHFIDGDIRFEPQDALISGSDGLDAIRAIVDAAAEHLAADGLIAIEHGFDQGESVAALLTSADFRATQQHDDLAGIWRITSAMAPRCSAQG